MLHGLRFRQHLLGAGEVAGIDDEKKAVLAGALDAGQRMDRLVRLGQPGEHEKSDKSRRHRAQHRDLERDRDKGRPARERPPANVDRVCDRGAVPLQEKAAGQSQHPGGEYQHRQHPALARQHRVERLHRIGRVSLKAGHARGAQSGRGLHQGAFRGEFGGEAGHPRRSGGGSSSFSS